MSSSFPSFADRLRARLAHRLLGRPAIAGLVNRIGGSVFVQRLPELDPFAACALTYPELIDAFAGQAGPTALADLNRVQMLAQAARGVQAVGGAIAEFGVYKGKTAKLLRVLMPTRDLYLFDTFEGFDSRDIDGEGARIDPAGRQALSEAFKDSSLESVRRHVGVAPNTHYVVGRFPESAADLPDDVRFTLVHVDCDLYEPARTACEWFYPRLAPGGMMIFHDYNSPHWPGIARAVDEYFADKPTGPVPIPDLSGSVCVRKGVGTAA